ncbi:MAG TPA: 3-methyl-2-oxobutanoate hydroxymethyltransferase [Candidatus Marinimicrobia bacterium]|nr:3-methyl-2-oxobutanoate hydroxymethyltransferase [Candidatus Neomarinimicrobiota bacterium]
MNKITIRDIQELKGGDTPFATITAYDYVSAQNADAVDIPLLLVGDSAAMVVYGMENTIPISMDELLFLVRAVCRGTKKALVVADMPFMSYQASVEDAVRNAGRFVKEGGACAIKLEGGTPYTAQIRAIIDAGIPVMGHVGLLPQSYNLSSGYRIQGKSKHEADKIIEDAEAVQESGAFAVVLEGVPGDLAERITKLLDIPTIGIGAGPFCDGQIQVYHDILGLYGDFSPKHAKRYGNFGVEIQKKLAEYKNEVEGKTFPTKEHFITSKTQLEKTH